MRRCRWHWWDRVHLGVVTLVWLALLVGVVLLSGCELIQAHPAPSPQPAVAHLKIWGTTGGTTITVTYGPLGQHTRDKHVSDLPWTKTVTIPASAGTYTLEADLNHADDGDLKCAIRVGNHRSVIGRGAEGNNICFAQVDRGLNGGWV